VLLNLVGRLAIVAAVFVTSTTSASAQHLVGGTTPSTFAEGLLSGIAHPIVGPDHPAFLLALGIAVGVFRLSFVNPFLFVAAMICGVAMHLAGLYLPAADLIVPVSVLTAGLMLAIEERIPPACWMAVFVGAGLFHGYIYESIYGADAVPLVAFMIGLAAVQIIMTIGVAIATRGLWKLWKQHSPYYSLSCVRRLISSMTMLLSFSLSPWRTHASSTAAWTSRSGSSCPILRP